MAVKAYVFRYQSAHDYIADAPARAFDGVVALPGLKIVEDVGVDALTNGSPLFVAVSHFSLLTDLTSQCTQPPEKLVFLLDGEMPPEEPFLSCIKDLKEKGFTFAIENVKNFDYMEPVVQMCDYIMMSFKFNMNNLEVFRQISPKATARYKNHIFIATDVNSISGFHRLKENGFHYLEGRFYNMPMPADDTALSPVKINRIQLMNTVREPDFSIEEVVKIVSRDPSISISLLQLINSPHLGLSQKVKSVQHAVALLGQNEVRKWVTTVIAQLLADDKPSELTRLSLIRAKFAENLSRYFEQAMHNNALFLMGLFSVLDVALNMPMEDALRLISVTEDVHAALVHRKGKFVPIYEFILAYEQADWTAAKNIMAMHVIRAEDVFNAYIETVKWYDTIISPVDFDE
ncbi:MAG: HDOD domain-containing protein [Defluviitaleaceae bacterium]|nr:HDOD domain-containing protein [Defluviitaleaceae bacterium]